MNIFDFKWVQSVNYNIQNESLVCNADFGFSYCNSREKLHLQMGKKQRYLPISTLQSVLFSPLHAYPHYHTSQNMVFSTYDPLNQLVATLPNINKINF